MFHVIRKIASLLTSALFLIFIPVSAGTSEFTLSAGDYLIRVDAEGFDLIDMTGFSFLDSPGDPALPQRISFVAVPPDVDWKSLQLSIISMDTEKLPGLYKIKPVSPDAMRDGEVEIIYWGEGKDIVDGKNMNVYGVDALFPSKGLESLKVSQMRKWKFIGVGFTPFQYNPVTGELILIKKIRAKLDYLQTGEMPNTDLMNDTVMDAQAQKMFLNYQESKNWYAGDNPGDSKNATDDYVIITSNAIVSNSTNLSAFITHKTNRGYSVRTVTETDFGVLTGQAPNHKAEKIRQWLIANYAALGIEYVLFIGDPTPYETLEGDVPMKLCWPRYNESTYKESPTDVFFSDLTGNWDFDGDQIYGEFGDDYYYVTGGVDFTPEVYVGRIAVYYSDYSSMDNILQKIMDNENETSIAWRENILLPMSFSDVTYDGAPLAEQMRDDYLSSQGYSFWRQYQQGSGACGLNSIYTSEEELREAPWSGIQ